MGSRQFSQIQFEACFAKKIPHGRGLDGNSREIEIPSKVSVGEKVSLKKAAMRLSAVKALIGTLHDRPFPRFFLLKRAF